MQLTLVSSRDTSAGLLLEEGLLAGRRYRLEPRICHDPVCQCESVTLHCFPETKEPLGPSAAICLEMDFVQRTIANLEKLKVDPSAFSLAKAVESEMSEEAWNKLRSLYFAVKQHQTEHADPNLLDVSFPPEVLAGDGSLVGYYEILPYAKSVEFILGTDIWFVDDQYCVNPACSCREAALSFVLTRPTTALDCGPIKASLSLRYAYDTGRIETLSGAAGLGLSGQDFLNALKGTRPDLNSLLAKRHIFLKRLFRRALGRKTLRLPSAQPGRNDPCPCGSGKKYKRCCGAA